MKKKILFFHPINNMLLLHATTTCSPSTSIQKKKNYLTINLKKKKETQLTNDGTDVILNGYASWVYFEEILGRASRYKSFWWSPDSKKIAYMRMDESEVP